MHVSAERIGVAQNRRLVQLELRPALARKGKRKLLHLLGGGLSRFLGLLRTGRRRLARQVLTLGETSEKKKNERRVCDGFGHASQRMSWQAHNQDIAS
jgi:hypothetical protein